MRRCQIWTPRGTPASTPCSCRLVPQVRKLEFLLADALRRGCDSVVTCGSLQSNHARATAVAARQLGLSPHLMLKCRVRDTLVFVVDVLRLQHKPHPLLWLRKFGHPIYYYTILQDPDPNTLGSHGNLLLDRLSGAKIVLIPPKSSGYIEDMWDINARMRDYGEKLKSVADTQQTSSLTDT